jgi:hypothetical protein
MTDGPVVEKGRAAVGDRVQGHAQPRIPALDGGGEGVREWSGQQVGEQAGVRPPGGDGEGAVDLLVFDHVRPVGGDPVAPGSLGIDGGLEEFGGVVEG